jgi:hypothetical protein
MKEMMETGGGWRNEACGREQLPNLLSRRSTF